MGHGVAPPPRARFLLRYPEASVSWRIGRTLRLCLSASLRAEYHRLAPRADPGPGRTLRETGVRLSRCHLDGLGLDEQRRPVPVDAEHLQHRCRLGRTERSRHTCRTRDIPSPLTRLCRSGNFLASCRHSAGNHHHWACCATHHGFRDAAIASRARPIRPCVPTTMRSAPHNSAAAMSASAVEPCTMTASALTPARAACSHAAVLIARSLARRAKSHSCTLATGSLRPSTG